MDYGRLSKYLNEYKYILFPCFYIHPITYLSNTERNYNIFWLLNNSQKDKKSSLSICELLCSLLLSKMKSSLMCKRNKNFHLLAMQFGTRYSTIEYPRRKTFPRTNHLFSTPFQSIYWTFVVAFSGLNLQPDLFIHSKPYSRRLLSLQKISLRELSEACM